MGNYKLISVESRKGGVGKTTAALNLGYLLRENYHVLLLDIDITGTSISAIQKSRFWMNDTVLLKNGEEPINLLQYFSNTFLKGEDLFEFTVEEDPNNVQVRNNSINVIASELYGEDALLLYDPALLLENLHVYWLTKMITSVCDRFEKCFDDDKPCIIILDNSPGFVGIGKAVHDIMTDMGPERAKFLTVSSLDIQDLESSLKSVYSLHHEYLEKLNGAHFPETHEGDERFYAQVQLSGETEYAYYKQKPKEANLSSYQGLILNKVAKNIIEGRTQYDYQRYLTERLKGVFNKLYDGHVKAYQVPFDNVLLTQFYGVFEDKGNWEKPNQTALKKRLSTIEGQIKGLDYLNAETLPYALLRRANSFEKSIDALKGSLIACGYEVIASKFRQEWLPMEPMRRMLEVLKRSGFTSEGFELYIPKNDRMQREMVYFHGMVSRGVEYSVERNQEKVWLAAAVASLACELSFCYSNKIQWNNTRAWNNDAPWGDNKEHWVRIVNDALYDWMVSIADSYAMFQGERLSLAAYVIRPEAEGCDNSLREIFDNDEFVDSLKDSVSRIMDLGPDMQTLINLIRTITIFNEGSFSLDVDFVQFLNRKIVEKRYDYYQAKERMYSELRDSDYMAAYREVLTHVVNNWGL